MSIDQFTEDSYEQALIELFQGMGYQYECGYDVERDFREPYYAPDLKRALKRQNLMPCLHEHCCIPPILLKKLSFPHIIKVFFFINDFFRRNCVYLHDEFRSPLANQRWYVPPLSEQ